MHVHQVPGIVSTKTKDVNPVHKGIRIHSYKQANQHNCSMFPLLGSLVFLFLPSGNAKLQLVAG